MTQALDNLKNLHFNGLLLAKIYNVWVEKHCTKTIFSFSRRTENMVFPKKVTVEYDLSCIIGKDDISFPGKYDLTPRRKLKDDLSQKNTRKCDIFFKCSKKMVFSKRIALGYDLSCTIWKGGIFFSRKHDIFSLDGKGSRDDLPQEIDRNMIFSVYTYRCYKREI